MKVALEPVRSPSYKPCHCGMDCTEDGTAEEPCWGQVQAVDRWDCGDDFVWIHACEGHDDIVAGSTIYYNKEGKAD